MTLTNQSQILAENRGSQKGGDVSIQAEQINIENGSKVFVHTFGEGRGGNVNIDTKELTLQNQAIVKTSTFGEAQGGDLTVNASDFVQLIGNDQRSVAPTPDLAIEFAKKALAQQVTGLGTTALGSGDAGNLTINTERLIARYGAGALTAVLGTGNGNGGALTVNASQSVELTGAAALAATTLNAGKVGSLTVHTGQLTVQDGAVLAVDTLKDGNAGSLTIDTQQLTVRNGSRVGAGTFGSGNGGSVTIKASDLVEVAGTSANSQSSASQPSTINTASAGLGNAGYLTIDTKRLIVRDGAVLTTSSLGAGQGGNPSLLPDFRIQIPPQDAATGSAGNLTIQANSVYLNRGTLLAQTAKSSPEGRANITLSGLNGGGLDLLRMDNESLISAQAFNQANGGNISIDTKLLVALPAVGSNGSDIIARANRGNGGNITINTDGIFGIKERKAIRGNRTNDIDASSDFGLNGTFQLNTPGIDPSHGLTVLPANVIDSSQLIANSCIGRGNRKSGTFIYVGNGGKASTADDPLVDPYRTYEVPPVQSASASTPFARTLDPENTATAHNTTYPTKAPLVEAQGWVYGSNGEVILTAQAPNLTSHDSWSKLPPCQDSR